MGSIDRRDPSNDLIQIAFSLGQRNRAGAPISTCAPSFDAQLALRLLTAAHEVMQRVVAQPARHPVSNLAEMIQAMAAPRAAARIGKPRS